MDNLVLLWPLIRRRPAWEGRYRESGEIREIKCKMQTGRGKPIKKKRI